MTTPADDALLTLDEAAKLIPGADAGTLKRRARQGKLVTYRPGKAYMTTRADVWEMVKQCRVTPTAPAKIPPISSSVELANAALDSTLARLKNRKR
jgi:hypothetical protein